MDPKKPKKDGKSNEQKMVRPDFSKTDTDVQTFVNHANEELHDALFIPHIKDIKNCYSGDFVMMTRDGVKNIIKEIKHITFKDAPNAKIFLYSEKYKRIVPFQKNDYLMYDDGYMRCDGNICYYYDNLGHELGTNTLYYDSRMIDHQDDRLIA